MLWRFILIVMAAWALTSAASAQAVTEIPSGDHSFTNLAITAYQDQSGQMREEAVEALPASQFKSPKAFGPLNFKGVYWAKALVHNPSQTPQPITVTAGWWDYTNLTFTHADGRVERRNASQYRRLDDTGLGDYPYIMVAPGETVSLLAELSHGGRFRNPMSIGLKLSRTIEQVEREQLRLIVLMFVTGMVFGLACYGAVLFADTRESAFLWFTLSVLTAALSYSGQVDDVASPLSRIVFPHDIIVGVFIKRVIGDMTQAALLMFTRSFLLTRKRWPSGDAVLLSLAVVMVARAIFINLWPDWREPSMFLLPLPQFAALAAALVVARQGVPEAKGFAVAQCASIAFYLCETVQSAGIVPTIPTDHPIFSLFNRYHVGLIGEAARSILFALALSQRMQSLRSALAREALARAEERQTLIEEANLRLEHDVESRTRALAQEKARSDALLNNVLPAAIAEELSLTGSSPPRRFEDCSILFTDFVGFTNTVATLPPTRMVEELNALFTLFDAILVEEGVEKIKTVGDSYLVAAGLPEPQADHAERLVRAALAMQAVVMGRNAHASIKWHMRAGIHSGSAVAGVVGKTKFSYDVWGDTVNIASRIEAAAEPGEVNVSAYTWDLVRHAFDGDYRGKVEAKDRGAIDMYFVRPTASPAT